MRILHVASFVGNIGDNASHIGLYRILKFFFEKYTLKQLEIRKFYKNYKGKDRGHFDQEFVKYANSFDLLIFGGGGFFDYSVPGSATGTTMDVDLKLLEKKLKVPALFTSLGAIPHRKIPEENYKRFKDFVGVLNGMEKIQVALRNDGSAKHLEDNFGFSLVESFYSILDNGFFYKCSQDATFPFENYIALSVSHDQAGMAVELKNGFCKKNYVTELSEFVNYACNKNNLGVVFVPHIYQDLLIISEILSCIDDYTVRSSLAVAPCVQHDRGANFLFSIYKKAKMVLGTRLHANICSLAMGVPTVGLAVLDRIGHLYGSLGGFDSAVDPVGDFHLGLCAELDQVLCGENKDLTPAITHFKEDSIVKYREMFSVLGVGG